MDAYDKFLQQLQDGIDQVGDSTPEPDIDEALMPQVATSSVLVAAFSVKQAVNAARKYNQEVPLWADELYPHLVEAVSSIVIGGLFDE